MPADLEESERPRGETRVSALYTGFNEVEKYLRQEFHLEAGDSEVGIPGVYQPVSLSNVKPDPSFEGVDSVFVWSVEAVQLDREYYRRVR